MSYLPIDKSLTSLSNELFRERITMSDTEGGPKPVRKAKSAFLFYQGDVQSKIRAELGGASMGDVMTEVSSLVLIVLLCNGYSCKINT